MYLNFSTLNLAVHWSVNLYGYAQVSLHPPFFPEFPYLLPKYHHSKYLRYFLLWQITGK